MFSDGGILNEIEECEDEDPDKVNEVPVQTDFFNQLIILFTIESPLIDQDENNQVDHYSGEYVESVETGNEEEEISKQWSISVLVLRQIGSFNISY